MVKLWKTERSIVRAKSSAARELEVAREALEKALSRREHGKALVLLTTLAALEPDEPRWPHKQGDVLHSLGRSHEAAVAYRLACECYVGRGFAERGQALKSLARSLAGQSANLSQVHRSIRPSGTHG